MFDLRKSISKNFLVRSVPLACLCQDFVLRMIQSCSVPNCTPLGRCQNTTNDMHAEESQPLAHKPAREHASTTPCCLPIVLQQSLHERTPTATTPSPSPSTPVPSERPALPCSRATEFSTTLVHPLSSTSRWQPHPPDSGTSTCTSKAVSRSRPPHERLEHTRRPSNKSIQLQCFSTFLGGKMDL